jgi:hypothetical protein
VSGKDRKGSHTCQKVIHNLQGEFRALSHEWPQFNDKLRARCLRANHPYITATQGPEETNDQERDNLLSDHDLQNTPVKLNAEGALLCFFAVGKGVETITRH